MTDRDTLAELEVVAEDIAGLNGAALEWSQVAADEWLVSMEPTGEQHGDWMVRGAGRTKALALGDLIRNAKDEGRAAR